MNKIHNHIKGNFTMIPNELIRHIALSDRARFLYVVLAQKPQEWDFFTKELSNSLGMHPDTFRKYRDELSDSGWITIEEQKTQNCQFKTKIYHINATPEINTEKNLVKTSNQQKERILPSRKNTTAVKNGHGKNHSLNNTNYKQKKNINKNNSKFLENNKNSIRQNPNPRQ
ncbi:helix-turn-helix domain-containing protein [Polaribacter undariae]|uniref:Helix-turn-helix domain-containing protein n=1 Tax=Polaribacter sejongensis TaxID=985043 RepID=A0AAJ1QWK5_9FLAO|nr:helix-turn-helix domain-containing protein [Polaribacter undariae]MDN3619402.1 helix-turn-helix domain-containing protein [Polaribacter undariae]UWD33398.1 helix-turn-helix domain-containing protein [Polaribacter undariae]